MWPRGHRLDTQTSKNRDLGFLLSPLLSSELCLHRPTLVLLLSKHKTVHLLDLQSSSVQELGETSSNTVAHLQGTSWQD